MPFPHTVRVTNKPQSQTRIPLNVIKLIQ